MYWIVFTQSWLKLHYFLDYTTKFYCDDVTQYYLSCFKFPEFLQTLFTPTVFILLKHFLHQKLCSIFFSPSLPFGAIGIMIFIFIFNPKECRVCTKLLLSEFRVLSSKQEVNSLFNLAHLLHKLHENTSDHQSLLPLMVQEYIR